jgi:putative transposase
MVGTAMAVGAAAPPARKRSPRKKFEVPDGWVARGFTFEVTWPDSNDAVAKVRSQFGGRRFAYNWALAQVKADMDAKKTGPSLASVPWALYALRKRFSAEKTTIAPWWRESSKEAYSTGTADLCTALENWKDSKTGKRQGKAVGPPKFKSRRKDQARVRFTTGVIRVEPDRRTITLAVVGPLRSKEDTRRLERLVAADKARILSATLSERWGRLFVSFNCIVEAHPYAAPAKGGRAGVDLGLRALATIADDSGTFTEVPNPAPLPARSSSAAGWDDSSPDVPPARRAIERRKPSLPGWTAEPCTCAESPTTSSPRCWRAPTARWSSKTSTSPP